MLREKFLSDLRPGENLLWCEAPTPVKLFAAKRSFLTPVLFAAFLIGAFWATAADGGSGRRALYCFSVFVFGSFAYEALGAYRTLYGITTMRLLILRPSFSSTEITSYYPSDIEFLTKKRRKNGTGSIVFGAVRERGGKRTVTVPVGFFGIKDVDQVEKMIVNLKDTKMPDQ